VESTRELIVDGVDFALEGVFLAERRDEELRKAFQRAEQRGRLAVKLIVGVLLCPTAVNSASVRRQGGLMAQ
jgi:hypothetical protein